MEQRGSMVVDCLNLSGMNIKYPHCIKPAALYNKHVYNNTKYCINYYFNKYRKSLFCDRLARTLTSALVGRRWRYQ